MLRLALLCTMCLALVLGSTAAGGPKESFALGVHVTGTGTVRSSPNGINCPGTCNASFPPRTSVVLNQAPGAGWEFSGWSGDCAGDGSCHVTMNADHGVSATFQQLRVQFTLTVSVTGPGSVASSPGSIACPGSCSEDVDQGTQVTLAPLASASALFTGWGGACSGTGICKVTVNAPTTASATFQATGAAPPQTQAAPDTGKPDRGASGPPYRLALPFTCYSANDSWLDRVYRDVLKRPVDQASLEALGARLDQGTPRSDVALTVLQSVEYRTKLVQVMYQSFLHRQPAPGEIAFALNVLASSPDEALAALILGSDEYLAARGGGTNDGFLSALFQDLLGRAASTAEKTAFEDALGTGTTRQQVAANVLGSHESHVRLVQGLYQSLLGRQPTQAELDALVNQLDQGATDEQVGAAILASSEYLQNATAYKATIDWGDGSTSPATVANTEGRCTADGKHTYDSNGKLTLTVDVTSPDGTHTKLTRPLTIVPPPPPPPGKENVRPSGTVLIKKNARFVPLTGFAQVPLGTVIDTGKGTVTLTSHDGSTGQFYGGVFRLGQESDRRIAYTTITLTGGNFGVCPTTKKARKPSASKPKSVRHVWGNAKGHFRTKGEYASATVRGALWLTDDQCPGTRVTVRRGVVDVFDLVERKHVFTHAGRSYLATPKK